ncbi:MAG: LuxR family transcriptional regulator [Bacteroidia bacterium]|nr:LuxR family transcriptional regulator [Bacteroidia bacterium]
MKRILLLFCIVISFNSLAQEHAPIITYSSKDYNAHNQNWSISQTSNNYIYIANNAGLLEFNGAEWNLFEMYDSSIVRSVKVVDDKVFTGSFMDFGVWEKNEFGTLFYSSLVKMLNLDILEDEQFWSINELDGWLLFQSLSRIYLINIDTKESRVISSESPITKMFKVREDIYFQKRGEGIFKIENGTPKLVYNNSIVKDNEIISVLELDSNLLFVTNKSGIYKQNNNSFSPFINQNQIILNNINIYSAIQLEDKSIVLGTISKGIMHLDKNGNLIQNVNHNNGLSNNTVLSLFEDKYNNLWIGLDNGVNCINLASRFRIYTDNNGTIGTIYTSISHKDYLYLGTNQGLFYRDRKKGEKFSLINETKGQVWTLKNINGELFCGHNNGTYIIDNGKIETFIGNEDGSWDFQLIEDNPNLILQGNYKGLSILEKQNNTWKYRNKLEGFDISSRFFKKINNVIIVNHEFKGLYSLKVDQQLKEIKQVELVKNVKNAYGSSLFEFSNNLYYSNLEGVYKFLSFNKFEKDSIFSSFFKDYSSLTTMFEINEESDKLWRYADDNLLIISPSSVSVLPQLDSIPISKNIRNAVAGFENVSKISKNEYLMGNSNSYIVFNTLKEDLKTDFEIQINAIQAHKIDQPKTYLKLSENINLNNKHNNIEFSYSLPNYNKLKPNEYQYQLLGLSNKWSNWEEKPIHFFENLPNGNYTFNVRGKIGDQITTNIATYSFTIDKPWFLSNIAIALYVIGLIVMLLIFHSIYNSYYKKQKKELIVKAQKELKHKELKNKQELTSLKNEKLKQDFENKSRELAISTMSLIKKNEFLNNIKKELVKIDNENTLKHIVRTIDNNLNNTDDWKLFEEAFNNADKDFLNKIKDIHPKLTPNDLKLCAYLRLNLSSKEIAPLLNISHRSVEVKRYRLRKKMNLPHESSLTKYILEL